MSLLTKKLILATNLAFGFFLFSSLSPQEVNAACSINAPSEVEKNSSFTVIVSNCNPQSTYKIVLWGQERVNNVVCRQTSPIVPPNFTTHLTAPSQPGSGLLRIETMNGPSDSCEQEIKVASPPPPFTCKIDMPIGPKQEEPLMVPIINLPENARVGVQLTGFGVNDFKCFNVPSSKRITYNYPKMPRAEQTTSVYQLKAGPLPQYASCQASSYTPICQAGFYTCRDEGCSVDSGFGVKYCDPPQNTKLNTALGCIPIKDTTGFIAWILKFAIGIGGGIAFILMLIGVFQIITSSGDPERLKAGKELITSALIGLLMIIFSLFLLQLIGVQILQIPGFGK